jgi:hypothetical protein
MSHNGKVSEETWNWPTFTNLTKRESRPPAKSVVVGKGNVEKASFHSWH